MSQQRIFGILLFILFVFFKGQLFSQIVSISYGHQRTKLDQANINADGEFIASGQSIAASFGFDVLTFASIGIKSGWNEYNWSDSIASDFSSIPLMLEINTFFQPNFMTKNDIPIEIMLTFSGGISLLNPVNKTVDFLYEESAWEMNFGGGIRLGNSSVGVSLLFGSDNLSLRKAKVDQTDRLKGWFLRGGFYLIL